MLVEGADDEHVIYNLRQKNNFTPLFEVFNEKSDNALLKDLPTRLKAGGIAQLGILLDADDFIERRWSRLKKILEKEGYSAPEQPDPDGTIVDTTDEFLPRVGIWLMPDNVHPGMLENFLVELVPADDPLWKRANETVEAIPIHERLFKEQHLTKAVVHTWLAWQEEPGIPFGRAIGRGFFAHTSPIVDRFLLWLARLYE